MTCSVREVRKHFNQLQLTLGTEKIANVPEQQKPLVIIAASSSSIQDFLSKLTQIHTSNQEKMSNSFGKLSDRVQNMILVASSRGSVVPTT